MSLSGNLGFVSLDEVLRLLIRSGQRGRVTVRGEAVEGRVFVTRGGITLATTTTDDGLETLFRKSRMVDPREIASESIDPNDQEVIDLLREVTVESIYRLNMHGDSFDVTEGVDARFASPKPFELEQLLEESRKRLEDWAEVSQVVSNLDARLAFVRDLGEREEVKIRRDAWKVLSEVGAGASITQIAAELGTTEFWAARVVARLVEDDLLTTVGGGSEVTQDEAWETPSQPVYEESPPEDVYSYGYEEPVEASDAEEEPSYFQQPQADSHEDSEPAAEEQTEEPTWETEPVAAGDIDTVDPADDVDADRSWWEEPSDETEEGSGAEDDSDDDGDVEEDTEAFLEKVFSELDSSEDESEEGYGLLRRRRLGAMRDIARDS